MANQQEAVFRTLVEWLKTLDRALQHLRHQQRIFKEVQAIWRANPRSCDPPIFSEYMFETYTTSGGVAVRRLVDRHPDAISFFRFLMKLKTNPGTLTRERYKAMFVDGNYTEREADALWDELVGKGNSYPQETAIDAEIALLEQKTNILVGFIDRRIAHHDRRDAHAVPTVKDLDEAIDYLEALFCKYYTLFTGLVTQGLTPVIHEDWQAVFRHPWIPEEP